MNKEEENCTACGLCALVQQEAITMKAEEKADEKHLYREEICVDI
jgi:NAD-dependent dihydropyrimidine dehydrogenase PreA subunit